jgi:hypothetical protein
VWLDFGRDSLRHAVARDIRQFPIRLSRWLGIGSAIGVPSIAGWLALTNRRLLDEPTLSDAFVIGLLAVSATVFALVTAIATLIISTASDPIDRQRMIRRYRDQAFDLIALYGIMTTAVIALISLFGQRSSAGAIEIAAEWPLGLFVLLLVAVGYLVYFVHDLVATPADEKVRWLEAEIEESYVQLLAPNFARTKLNKWIAEDGLSVDAKYDVGMDGLILRPTDLISWVKSDGYLHDISRRRLRSWLSKVQRLEPPAGRPRIAGVLDRRFRLGEPIAVVPLETTLGSEVSTRMQVEAHSVFQLSPDDPLAEMQTSLKDLRDKGRTAARDGRTAEFEFILETFTRLVTRTFKLSDQYKGQFAGDPTGLAPRVLLRAAVHELGEEVFSSPSPNIIKAWMHLPQRLLQASRWSADRAVYAMMYSWWRTAQLLQRWGRTSVSPDVELITESLLLRLHYYAENLSAAIRWDVPEHSKQLQEERFWLGRIVARIRSAIDPIGSSQLHAILGQIAVVPGVVDQKEFSQWGLLTARHLLADIDQYGPGDALLGDRWNTAFTTSPPLSAGAAFAAVIGAYGSMLDSDGEKIEARAYVMFAQMIDLTWEEQRELALGRWHPYLRRDPKEDLGTVTAIRCLEIIGSNPGMTAPREFAKDLRSVLSVAKSDESARQLWRVVSGRAAADLANEITALLGTLPAEP